MWTAYCHSTRHHQSCLKWTPGSLPTPRRLRTDMTSSTRIASPSLAYRRTVSPGGLWVPDPVYFGYDATCSYATASNGVGAIYLRLELSLYCSTARLWQKVGITIPTCVRKYCIVCVFEYHYCINFVSLYNDCIVLHCMFMLLYTVWPLTHCIAFFPLDAAVIVLW